MKIAIIFASGKGTRLKPLTNTTHKSLLKFNNKYLIEYLIENLLQVDKLTKIFIVIKNNNELFKTIKNLFPEIIILNNDNYPDNYQTAYNLKILYPYLKAATNSFFISGDMIMKNNDFILNLKDNIITSFYEPHSNQKSNVWSFTLDANNNINKIYQNKNNDYTVGEWSYISNPLLKYLSEEVNNPKNELLLRKMFIEEFIVHCSKKYFVPIKPLILKPNSHWDLDTFEDLEFTNNYFNSLKNKK